MLDKLLQTNEWQGHCAINKPYTDNSKPAIIKVYESIAILKRLYYKCEISRYDYFKRVKEVAEEENNLTFHYKNRKLLKMATKFVVKSN